MTKSYKAKTRKPHKEGLTIIAMIKPSKQSDGSDNDSISVSMNASTSRKTGRTGDIFTFKGL